MAGRPEDSGARSTEDLDYLCYCHGPAGTARLFYQLYKVTDETSYLRRAEKLAEGIVASGVLEKLTPERSSTRTWRYRCADGSAILLRSRDAVALSGTATSAQETKLLEAA